MLSSAVRGYELPLSALKDAMGHGVPSHPDLEGSCARANKFYFNLNCDKNRTMCDLNVQMLPLRAGETTPSGRRGLGWAPHWLKPVCLDQDSSRQTRRGSILHYKSSEHHSCIPESFAIVSCIPNDVNRFLAFPSTLRTTRMYTRDGTWRATSARCSDRVYAFYKCEYSVRACGKKTGGSVTYVPNVMTSSGSHHTSSTCTMK